MLGDKKSLIAEKRAIKILGFDCLEHEERKKIPHVIRSLKETGAKLEPVTGAEIRSVISVALKDFSSVLGKDIANQTATNLVNIPFKSVNALPHLFAVNVQYNVDEKTKKVDKNSGVVDHFKIPFQLSESDSVFIGHELIHMNKEVNYAEYKLLLTLSDVIPILYEFIVMGENAKNILNNRLFWLNLNVKEYETAMKKIKSSGMEKDLYKMVRDRNAQYLNSFYYATVLYKKYQDDPELILNYIRKVVMCEMSTLDMLKDLGIYLIDNNDIYDEQVRQFKKIIKK